MKSEIISPREIRKIGLESLAKVLGPIGMVRFLQQFEAGRGNYTKERVRWFGKITIQDIVKEIRKKRCK
ncbi:MAG: hypothetical protein AB1393_12620 [Candidatus Edwardsbacteria bacterium]